MPDQLNPTEQCPICNRPSATDRLRPFCSRRCADVDLGRWFVGAYSVPTVEADDDTIDEN